MSDRTDDEIRAALEKTIDAARSYPHPLPELINDAYLALSWHHLNPCSGESDFRQKRDADIARRLLAFMKGLAA